MTCIITHGKTPEDILLEYFSKNPKEKEIFLRNYRRQFGKEKFEFISGNTYAVAQTNLIKSCNEIKSKQQTCWIDGYRLNVPLTIKQIMELRVESDPLNKESIWHHELSSSTTILSSEGSTIRKICPLSIEYVAAHDEAFLTRKNGGSFMRQTFVREYEIDTMKADCFYNLKKEVVLEHPGWLAIVEGNKDLLKDYSDIAFNHFREGMKFLAFPPRSYFTIAEDYQIGSLNNQSSIYPAKGQRTFLKLL